MDLDDYDYSNKPYTIAKIFDIHALSQEGFSQYIGPNSYAHKYLNKITPKLLTKFKSSEGKIKNVSSNISKLCNIEDRNNEDKVETLIHNEFQSTHVLGNKYQETEKQADKQFYKQIKDFGYKTSMDFTIKIR
jgi:hypothetical protein